MNEKLDSVYLTLFYGEAAMNAHKIYVDFPGLIRMVQTCESLKMILVANKVVNLLSAELEEGPQCDTRGSKKEEVVHRIPKDIWDLSWASGLSFYF